MRAQKRCVTCGLVLLTATITLSSCSLPSVVPTALWADVHPQGWVVFTGARPPFPPPTAQSYYDDKLLLFHPYLGITATLLEDPRESFSSPRWLATPDVDELFWVASQQKIYAMAVSFAEIERIISEPLQSTLPLSLQDARLLWAEESGVIHSLAPSPDGRFLAFLREESGQFTVVVLDTESTPVQKVAELSTVWLPQIVWDSFGKSVFVVREARDVTVGNSKLHVGEIISHEIATGHERTLVDDIVSYRTPPQGSEAAPGPLALSPDGQTLYYTTLLALPPRTAQEFRLGLYSVELVSGARRLLVELSPGEALQELAVAPGGRRLAFTTTSLRLGVTWSLHSALTVLEGTQVRQLAQQTNGWLFPLWLDDTHLAYVQFAPEHSGDSEQLPTGVRPALWVQDVETHERSNYLPMLAMQMQLDSLRAAVRRLQERIEALEKAVQELQAR
uniref:Lipoprotein n=1 Tax=Acetithermum autotrophicum TaxID=1446466 RepID=H5SQC4_ACEAU|nr:hypothetical protein HGMM_OP1C055 [Candidatus Acetothermum autotrophicum]